MSLYLSVSLSSCPRRFFAIIRAAHSCGQRIQNQAMGSNNLIGSIICPYVHTSGCLWAFCDFGFCINFQCGGPAQRCIYPHNWVQKNPEGSSRDYMSILMSVYMSVWPSVSLYGCSRRFWSIICASHIFVNCMRPQAMGPNPLSGSIMCPSVCLVFRGNFAVFEFLFIYIVGVQRCGAFILYTNVLIYTSLRGSDL